MHWPHVTDAGLAAYGLKLIGNCRLEVQYVRPRQKNADRLIGWFYVQLDTKYVLQTRYSQPSSWLLKKSAKKSSQQILYPTNVLNTQMAYKQDKCKRYV